MLLPVLHEEGGVRDIITALFLRRRVQPRRAWHLFRGGLEEGGRGGSGDDAARGKGGEQVLFEVWLMGCSSGESKGIVWVEGWGIAGGMRRVRDGPGGGSG